MLEYANDEKAIFLAALEQASVQEREAYLRGACGGNVELLKRVKVLLSVHEDSQGPLDAPSPGIGIVPTVDEPLTERPGAVIGPYKPVTSELCSGWRSTSRSIMSFAAFAPKRRRPWESRSSRPISYGRSGNSSQRIKRRRHKDRTDS